VQWHPEWDVDRSPESRAFFTVVGTSLRAAADAR
jgi:putative glutamine amidotransferase